MLNLLFIPESRQALPVYLGVFTLAIQLGLLLRSRGVGLASYFSMVAASALFAPVIYGVQVIVMAAFGWRASSSESSVLVAAPTEEVLKLVPLAAVLLWARHRAARFGIADHILLGAACGVGFGLTENVARALSGAGTLDLVEVFTSMEDGAGHQYSLFTLFPGWGGDSSMEAAGHAVWTALVAAGIGFARRYGPVLLSPLVLFFLAWACLDHMAWNQEASIFTRDLLPEQILLVHELLGSGQAARPALLVVVLLAVWADYRTILKVGDRLPPFPARRGAPSAPGSALGTLRAELLLQWRVLRSDRDEFTQAIAFVRSRRELGYGLQRAAGGPRRDAPPGPLLWDTGGRLHNVIAAGALLLFAGITVTGLATGGPGDTPAFLAPQLESLADWWNGLNPAQQLLLVAGGTAALMLIPGVGFWAALGWSTLAAGIAAEGRQIARTLRDGSPADLAYATIVVALGRFFPGSRVILPKGFRALPGNRFRSPAGLIYGPNDRRFGHRLDHIIDHLYQRSDKPRYSVFNVAGNRTQMLKLIDEAWTRRRHHGFIDPRQSNRDRVTWMIDMGREVGTQGEQWIAVAVLRRSNEIVTAFPVN